MIEFPETQWNHKETLKGNGTRRIRLWFTGIMIIVKAHTKFEISFADKNSGDKPLNLEIQGGGLSLLNTCTESQG
jgi:hypothetical protein